METVNLKFDWDSIIYKQESFDKTERYYIKFKDAVFSESEMLPVKNFSVSLNNYAAVSVQLKNAVYKTIDANKNWGQEFLQNEITFKTSTSKKRGRPLANVSFIPIRKNNSNGNYELLISGELEIYQEEIIADVYSSSNFKSNTLVSKLNDGLIYKITVNNTGVYKIDYNFLKNMGLDIDNIDPRNIQILGNGGKPLPEIAGSSQRIDDLNENAIFISGETDGVFNNNDFILFYAQGYDYWTFDPSNSFFQRNQNIYSNQISYFIKVANNPGKRVNNRSSLSATNYNTSTYDALLHYEDDKINLMEKEFSLPPSGRLWVGNPFQISRNQTFNFNFLNRVVSEPVKMKSSLYCRAFSNSSFTVKANNVSILNPIISSVNNYIYSLHSRNQTNISNFLSNDNNVDIEINFNNSSSTAEAWLDYLTLNARSGLVFTGGQLSFRDKMTIGQGSATYQISNANNVTIWDVTYPYDVENQNYTGNSSVSFGAAADTLRNFVVFDGNNFLVPNPVGLVNNQNLHGITSIPNLIVVFHPNFQSAAQRFAAHRASHSGITTLAVNVEQIYNEFSSGTPDIASIRDFAKMLYDRSSGIDSLRYLLLFGSGSFDYKGNGIGRTKNNNYILSYETDESTDPLKTYTSDDFYALLDDGEGNLALDNYLDIAVGRLPVTTSTEAEAMADKIIRYDSDPEMFGDWKNRLTFFADDQDGNLHLNDTEGIAQFVANSESAYNVDKIYCDAYPQVSTSGGSRYPDVNAALLNNIFKGSLTMCYLGHGGPDGLAQERIFTTTEINTLNNRVKMPLFVTATCSFAPYDDPESMSAGQLLILNPIGGSIALMTTVRVVLADANQFLTQKTFENIFLPIGNRMPTLGEILQNAKNNSGVLSASNSRKYILLGDPSMTLSYPKHNVVTTSINGRTSASDTIRALQRVTISGEVRDLNRNLLSNFNGIVYPTVYDKSDTIRTRANDADSYVRGFPLQKKIIFKGRATVTNGRFNFSFIVPVDINYTIGTGKISYYAENGLNEDANGAYMNLYIGGTDPNAAQDDKGPEVKVYMNNDNFATGGITDENPTLLVKLSDESGINTVGNGIGHDLTGMLNFIPENNELIYNLNEFYEANIDDFTSGNIHYPLSKLPVGKHLVKVKAWDVYNNMGEGMTEFVVATNAKMALDHVLNYPNPFTTNTEFMFEHNLPGQDLEVLIQIFTVSGKLVKTISKDYSNSENDGYRISGIQWDGLDEYGDKLGRGVYIYKVTVRASGAVLSGTESPVIQKNSEYQKLVILK